MAALRAQQLSPNLITFNATVDAAAIGRQWAVALALLWEMRHTSLQLDSHPYATVIDAMRLAGLPRRAADLYRRAQMDGIKGIASL